jgi:hypothetical protein
MKVYLFYRLFNGLDPQFYAFTHHKKRANLFKEYRTNFYFKEESLEEDEYKKLRDSSGGLEITLQNFKSHDGFRVSQIVLPITINEFEQFVLHKEEIAMRELRKCTFPIDIFKGKLREALEVLGYGEVSKYYEELAVINPYDYSSYPKPLNIKVDELSLFLLIHEDTISVENIKNSLT